MLKFLISEINKFMLVSPFRIVSLSGDSQVSKIYGKQEQITTPI